MRIYFLRIKKFTIKSIIFLLIPLVIFGIKINMLNKIPKFKDVNQEITLKINPDNLKIKNDSYYGIAYVSEFNQKIIFHGYFKSDKEKEFINNINKTSSFEIKGDLNEISESTNFGVFDSKMYYRQKNIINEVKINDIKIDSKIINSNFFDKIHDLRCKLIERNHNLPKSLRIYINSLIYGEMNEDFNDEMNGVKQLGLIHLFSISGFHIYYLISLITFIFTIFRIRIERINLFIFLFLPIYFIIAGSAPSLVRSILLSETRIIIDKLSINLNSLDLWSISLMINLLINPMIIFQLGGQLSYILSFALIYTKKSKFIQQTILMNLVGLPIIIFHVYEWHFLSLAINLIVLPIFSIIILPIVIFGYLGSFFTSFPIYISDFLLGVFDNTLDMISKLPGNIIFGKPNFYVIMLLLIITLFCLQQISKFKVTLLFLIYLMTFIWIHYPIKGEVTFIDVGQGDSIFIREPFNKSVSLIDTGGKLNFNKVKESKEKFQADRIGIRYLKSIGINKIDNIYLTHTDHVGDISAYLKSMNVDKIIIPIGMNQNPNFMKKIVLFKNDFKLIPVKSGEKITNSPLKILHPFKPGLGTNEDSMVLYGDFCNHSFLFMGDLDREGELEVLKRYPNLKAEILKLGHHGSKTSSDPSFIKQIQPKLAIISAGRNNRYNNPSKETIEILNQQNITYISTQTKGMIKFVYYFNQNKFVTKLF